MIGMPVSGAGLILAIPLVTAALLLFIPNYRLSARLNAASAFLTLLAALSLFVHKPAPDYYQSFGLGFFEYFQLAEDIGAEPFERRTVGRRQLEKRLEETVQAAPRAQEAPGLFHVEALAEAPQNGAAGEERRDGGLGPGLDEKVDLVRAGPFEEGREKAQDEDPRAAIAAVRRKGSEVDEDTQASPL